MRRGVTSDSGTGFDGHRQAIHAPRPGPLPGGEGVKNPEIQPRDLPYQTEDLGSRSGLATRQDA